MKVWPGKVFSSGHRHLMWCTEVHKQWEKVRAGECIDATRNYTTIKGIMLFVCGCYETVFACDQGSHATEQNGDKQFNLSTRNSSLQLLD